MKEPTSEDGEWGERAQRADRPAHLVSRDAERLFAVLFDDSIRACERGPDSSYSNATVGAACGVTESRVRAWRDPNGGRPLTAYRLLQLPDVVWRGLLERMIAVRSERRDDFGPASLAAASGQALGSMGRTIALLARTGELDERATDELAGALCAVLRDVRRLLRRLGRDCD